MVVDVWDRGRVRAYEWIVAPDNLHRIRILHAVLSAVGEQVEGA